MAQQKEKEKKYKTKYTRFHVDAADPPISGEQLFQIRMASVKIEVPTKHSPHLLESSNETPTNPKNQKKKKSTSR